MLPTHLRQLTVVLSNGTRMTRLPVGVVDDVAFFAFAATGEDLGDWWLAGRIVRFAHPSGREPGSRGGGGGGSDEEQTDHLEFDVPDEPFLLTYLDLDGATELASEVLDLR